MSEVKWGHRVAVTLSRGFIKVTCSCGEQSQKTDTDGASRWIEDHLPKDKKEVKQ